MQIGQTRLAAIREMLNKLVVICAHNPGLNNKYYIVVLRYSLVIVIITRKTGVKADECYQDSRAIVGSNTRRLVERSK